jgi:hypothetical protein
MEDYEDVYAADARKVAELMERLDKAFHGYSRMVVALACARSIAAMLGPARDDTRANFLERFPDYVRAMWRAMDAAIPRR